jgi:hypothetical protein
VEQCALPGTRKKFGRIPRELHVELGRFNSSGLMGGVNLAQKKLLVPRAARNVFPQQKERRVEKIVIKDLPEATVFFGHGPCTALKEADAVALASAFEDHLLALLPRSEIVAGHSVPAETAVHSESSGFAFCKQRGVL